MATADLITQLKQDFDDVYAAGKAAGGGSGGNVGYKTTEVEVTSNVTNSLDLFNIVFKDMNLTRSLIAFLTYPQETDYIYNQITYFFNWDGLRYCIRYRDGVYAIANVAANFDVAGTIGSVYTIVDLDEYVEDKDYDQGYEDGKNSLIPFEQYAVNIRFENLNLFGEEEIVLNLDNGTSLESLYSPTLNNVNKTVKHITVNCPNKISSLRQSFCGSAVYDRTLEHITLNVDTSLCQWWWQTFLRMNVLKIIDGTPLNLISVNNNGYVQVFQGCNELQEVRFVANSIKLSISFANCSNLSTETIQSIIDGLADLTGGTAQTLTLHATVGSKLTDEQKATITAKNWELVY